MLKGFAFTLIFYMLINPCRSQNLKGHWYNCQEDGLYVEINFEEKYFKSSWGLTEFMGEATYYYELSKDSLNYSTLPLTSVDFEANIKTAIISILDEETFALSQLGSTYTYHRLNIPDRPQPQSKGQNFAVIWYDEFEVGFNERLKQFRCSSK